MRKIVVPLFILLYTSFHLYAAAKDEDGNGRGAFMENRGQVLDQYHHARTDILFYGNNHSMSCHLGAKGISYQLYRQKEAAASKEIITQRIDIEWLGNKPHCKIIPSKGIAGYDNYYLNNKPILGVKSYGAITYQELYQGIDLQYHYQDGNLKYDYIVSPGADYQEIRLKIRGAALSLDSSGALILQTPLGAIKEGKPVVYQEGRQLSAAWKVTDDVASFDIGQYDKTKPLIIDPLVSGWEQWYGLSGWGSNEYAFSSAIDADGNVFMAGSADSTGLGVGGLLVKYDSSSTEIFSNLYGRGLFPGYVSFSDISIDGGSNLFVCGSTNESGNIATVGAFQNIFGEGAADALIMKISNSGTKIWASYYGGANKDVAASCTVDNGGNIFITGTTSSDTVFATPGAYQSSLAGGQDLFLAKFNDAGLRIWSTYFGGPGLDSAMGILYDTVSNSLYTCGYTSSITGIATTGAFQTSLNGIVNGYFAKVDTSGSVTWGSYFGEDSTTCNSIAADRYGDVYISGATTAASGISTAGSMQPDYSAGIDAFLAKFNSSGVRLWATYCGGGSDDNVTDCAVDTFGHIYLSGSTLSGNNIATPDGVQASIAGSSSAVAFLAEYDTAGMKTWGTYHYMPGGFNSTAYGYGCTTDNMGNAYLVGSVGEGILTFNYNADLTKYKRCNNQLPVITATDSFVCQTGVATQISVPQVSGAVYQWYTTVPSMPVSGANDNTYQAQYGLPVRYFVQVDYGDGCIFNADPIGLSYYPSFAVNASVAGLSCYGGSNGAIDVSVTGSAAPYSYFWNNTGDTTAGINNLVAGSYPITVTDVHGCTASSIIEIIEPSPVNTITAEICAVTVDSSTGRNMIIWEKTATPTMLLYKLYREAPVSGQYDLAASLSASQFSTWIDTLSIPPQQTYAYKISMVDSCGHESGLSNFHRTIHLAANNGINGEINLVWNQYEGKSYAGQRILRLSNGGPATVIAQLSSDITSYTDLNPPTGQKEYLISVDLDNSCNPTQKITAYASVFSNKVTLNASDRNSGIYPNPTTDRIFISNVIPALIKVEDIAGKLVLQTSDASQISLASLSPGVYLLKLFDNNGQRYLSQKIVKQ